MYIACGQKDSKTRHYIDNEKHDRISTGESLCGMPGSNLQRFDAAFFNYESVYPNMCPECLRIADERPDVERVDG